MIGFRRFGHVMGAIGLTAAAPALADLSGKAEAGLVIASGNTNTETANAKLSLANELGAWKHGFGGAALYASDEGGKTANRWETFAQTEYSFSPRTFWVGAARYEQDEFSGFEYQATVSTGLGRVFVDTAATQFSGTVGVGYKFFETRDSFNETTGALLEEGRSDDEVIFRGTLDFEHELTATTSITDKLIVEAGVDNTFAQNDLSLQVKINDVLALALGYSVRHNTDPPTGFQETDTLTTVNLVYELK